jgi:hypothetical protein
MKKKHTIAVPAGALLEALITIFPQRRRVSKTRPYAVTLKYDRRGKHLSIEEAQHGLCEYTIPAEGTWPEKVQVDGVLMKRLCKKFGRNDIVELIPLRDELCLLVKETRIVLKRLDPNNEPGIEKTPPPFQVRTGPVEIPPDPHEKRFAWNDTWAFSARVPMPQHRKRKD